MRQAHSNIQPDIKIGEKSGRKIPIRHALVLEEKRSTELVLPQTQRVWLRVFLLPIGALQ